MLILENWCHNKSEMPVKQQEKASYRSKKGEELALESDSVCWLKLQFIKNSVSRMFDFCHPNNSVEVPARAKSFQKIN